jgi:hypothetical protein
MELPNFQSFVAWDNIYCLFCDDEGNNSKVHALGGKTITIDNSYCYITNSTDDIVHVLSPDTCNGKCQTFIFESNKEKRLYLVNVRNVSCYDEKLNLIYEIQIDNKFTQVYFVRIGDSCYIICDSEKNIRKTTVISGKNGVLNSLDDFYTFHSIVADKYILIRNSDGAEKYIDTTKSIICDEIVIARKLDEEVVRTYNSEKKKVVFLLRKPVFRDFECVVCHGDIIERIAFVPCGHVNVCADCVSPIETCPTCKSGIAQKVKLHQ